MSGPAVGDTAPDFTLPGTDGTAEGHRDYTLSEFAGQPVVLAFYPGDNTPVCTRQLNSYTADIDQFRDVDAVVLAISPQSVESHDGFSAEQGGFAFPLLSDEDKQVGQAVRHPRARGLLPAVDLRGRRSRTCPLRPPGGGRPLVPPHRRGGGGRGGGRPGAGAAGVHPGRGGPARVRTHVRARHRPGLSRCGYGVVEAPAGGPGRWPPACCAPTRRSTCPTGWRPSRPTCGRCWPSTGPRWWRWSGSCSRSTPAPPSRWRRRRAWPWSRRSRRVRGGRVLAQPGQAGGGRLRRRRQGPDRAHGPGPAGHRPAPPPGGRRRRRGPGALPPGPRAAAPAVARAAVAAGAVGAGR